MLKSLFLIILCAVALPAFCEPSAKYEVATILDVKPHQTAGDNSSSAASYDISIKVWRHRLPGSVHRYIGHKLGEVCCWPIRTLGVRRKARRSPKMTFLGRSREIPIISQKPAKTTNPPKVIAKVLSGQLSSIVARSSGMTVGEKAI